MTDNLAILYVDDEPDIRLIVEMSLAMRPNLTVRTAPSGEEALAMLAKRDWRPDLMMVDVMMPGLSGPDVLDAVKADPVLAEIPVIFVTARARMQDIDAYVAQGAIGVITKPFDPLQLANQVFQLLDAA